MGENSYRYLYRNSVLQICSVAKRHPLKTAYKMANSYVMLQIESNIIAPVLLNLLNSLQK